MSLEKIWNDYCENGSIHGLRHIVQKDKSPLEKLMWVLMMIVASITILVLLSESWGKYSYSSMEIVVDDSRYPLSKIDFPAVTICSINKIIYSRAVDLLLKNFTKGSDMRIKWSNALRALGMLRYPHYTDLYLFLEIREAFNIPLGDIANIMMKLAPTLDEMFFRCYWRGKQYKCSDIFRFQRTEEGFCYSFNSKTAKRNANDSIFNPPLNGPDGSLIPLRNNAAGRGTGLKVIMKNLSSEFFPNDTRRRGYNIMVHTPEDFPDVSTAYKVHTVFDRISRIGVAVEQVLADSSLYRLDDNDRNCYMRRARSIFMKNDPSSHKGNEEDTCYSKCRMKVISELCNCTPYYFEVYNGVGQHCGIEHIPCLVNNDVLHRNTRPPNNEPGFPAWSLPAFMNCNCPLPCSFIRYTTELQHEIRQFIVEKPLDGRYMVHLEINYKNLYATNYQRSMKYTTQDLLVSFGGVASLFLGCSLVSVVEIFYAMYRTILVIMRKYSKDDTESSDDAKTTYYPFIK